MGPSRRRGGPAAALAAWAAAAAAAALAATLALAPLQRPSCRAGACGFAVAGGLPLLPRRRQDHPSRMCPAAAPLPKQATSSLTCPCRRPDPCQAAAALRAQPVGTEPPPPGRRERGEGGPSYEDRELYEETNKLPSEQFNTWTDYTKWALGVEDRFDGMGPEELKELKYTPLSERKPRPDSSDGRAHYQGALFDRRRSMGIDFGPEFVGLALSMGGPNTVPMGTVKTDKRWQETALKIVQMASTRRVREIVIGMPYESDGSEGRIAKLVRHFSQILADAALLVLGPKTTIYLWDERFSTVYAAMRLVTRPRFDGAAFKTWLDGQRGLNFGNKALLDAEAARTILEHWLEKDPVTEVLNKERSERVSPSKQACVTYLSWNKKKRIKPVRPKEPAGPGKEGWEWGDAHPESEVMDAEEYMQREEQFSQYMEGMDKFGDRMYELAERKRRRAEELKRNRRIEDLQDDSPLKEAFKTATAREGDDNVYRGFGPNRPENWKEYGE